MAEPERTSISDLPRGYVFAPVRFALDDARVRAYLAAVGDSGAYAGTVPPLAAVALGLCALQEQLSLPDGALHTGQEVEHAATIHTGADLSLRGRVAQRSERQGYVISVIEFEVAEGDRTAIRARTTIMAPVAAA